MVVLQCSINLHMYLVNLINVQDATFDFCFVILFNCFTPTYTEVSNSYAIKVDRVKCLSQIYTL